MSIIKWITSLFKSNKTFNDNNPSDLDNFLIDLEKTKTRQPIKQYKNTLISKAFPSYIQKEDNKLIKREE